MLNDKLIVSDTSPLRNLTLIDRLDLVREQRSTVTILGPVWDELLDGEECREALRGHHRRRRRRPDTSLLQVVGPRIESDDFVS